MGTIILRVIGYLMWNGLRGGVAFGLVLSGVLMVLAVINGDNLWESMVVALVWFGIMSVLGSLVLTVLPALLLAIVTAYGLRRWEADTYRMRMRIMAVMGLLVGHGVILLIDPRIILSLMVPAVIGVIAIWWSAGVVAADAHRVFLSIQK
jgi:hypothetical protein